MKRETFSALCVLLIVLVLASLARSQQFVLSNISDVDRSLAWSEPIGVPSGAGLGAAEYVVKSADGRSGRLALQRVARGVSYYRVRFPILGNEDVELFVGDIVRDQDPWTIHPWLLGSPIDRMMLRVCVTIGADTYVTDELVEQSAVAVSACVRRHYVHTWNRRIGVHLLASYDVCSGQPSVSFEARIARSCRTDPRYVVRVDGITLRSSAQIALDFADRNGQVGPFRRPDGDWETTAVPGRVDWLDSTGPAVSGSLLFRPPSSAADDAVVTIQSLANDADSATELVAASRGPIIGVWKKWNGSWLALGNVPVVRDGVDLVGQARTMFAAFRQQSATVRPPWTPVNGFGLEGYPGSAGKQTDFGATKGALMLASPRAIYVARCAWQRDAWRRSAVFEADGRALRVADHPQLATDAQAIHWSTSVSRDRLGLSDATWSGFPQGMMGYDRQHYSINYLAALCLLTDSEVVRDHLRDLARLLATDLTYRIHAREAARGYGRVLLAVAQMAACFEAADVDRLIRPLVDERFTVMAATPTIDTQPIGATAIGPPDARKPFRDPTTDQPTSWVSAWEDAIQWIGARAALPLATDQARATSVVDTLARSMIRIGAIPDGSSYWIVSDRAWLGGVAITSVADRRIVAAERDTGDVRSWTAAGLIGCAGWASRWSDVDADRLAARAAVLWLTGGGNEPANVEAAEWAASVPSIRSLALGK